MSPDLSNSRIASAQLFKLRETFEQAVADVQKTLLQPQHTKIFDINMIKKAVAAGVAKCIATDGLCLCSDNLEPNDEFCEIIASEVAALQDNSPAAPVPLDLFNGLHNPFKEIFSIVLAQTSTNPKPHDPLASKTNKAPLQSSAFIHPDRRAMLQANSTFDPVGLPSQGLTTQSNGQSAFNQFRGGIVIDSDDEVGAEEVKRSPSPATSKSDLPPRNLTTSSNFTYRLTLPDKSMAKHLGSLNINSIKALIDNAAQRPETRSKSNEWIASLSHLGNGDIEICTSDEESFKRLQYSTWSQCFQNKLSEQRKPCPVFVGKFPIAGICSLKSKHGQEIVKQRLVDLNRGRLESLTSTYAIIRLRWDIRPSQAKGVNTGVVMIDFAFKDVVEEAVSNGIVWDGEVRPCGKSRDRILQAKISHKSIERCGHCQRRGHHREYCPWPPRCSHCAKDHMTKDCTSLTLKCGLCNGDHGWGTKGCPRARFEEITDLETDRDKARMAWQLYEQAGKKPTSMNLPNPNSQPVSLPRRSNAGTWTLPVAPSTRERSEPIPEKDSTDRFTAPFIRPTHSNGKYQFAQPQEEYRLASRTKASQPEASWQQILPLWKTAPSIKPSATTIPSQPTRSFAFPQSSPSTIIHSTLVFGQPSTITPRLPLSSPGTPNPKPAPGCQLTNSSNKARSAGSINSKLVQELTTMRDKAIRCRGMSTPVSPHSSAEPWPVAHQAQAAAVSGIQGGSALAMRASSTTMILKRKTDENIRIGGEARDYEEQAITAKRRKLEQAAQRDGLPGLWMPR